jgi:RNA polymerase sigma factor (sigma-70 family)
MTNTYDNKPDVSTLLLDQNFQDLLTNTARKFVARYSKYGGASMIEVGDLVNEGMIASNTAYNSFDPTKDVLFSTHAFPYARHAMDAYCRKFCHVLSISEKDSREYLQEMTGTGVLRIDQQSSSEEGQFDIPVVSGLDSVSDTEEFLFSSLSDIERDVARLSLIEGMTTREIAAKFNISKSRVSNILRQAKERLKIKAEEFLEE